MVSVDPFSHLLNLYYVTSSLRVPYSLFAKYRINLGLLLEKLDGGKANINVDLQKIVYVLVS